MGPKHTYNSCPNKAHVLCPVCFNAPEVCPVLSNPSYETKALPYDPRPIRPQILAAATPTRTQGSSLVTSSAALQVQLCGCRTQQVSPPADTHTDTHTPTAHMHHGTCVDIDTRRVLWNAAGETATKPIFPPRR